MSDSKNEGFDPSDHTVDEVLSYVEDNPDEAAEIAEAEEEGKGRTTIAEALSDVERPARRGQAQRKVKKGKVTLEAGDSPSTIARQFLGKASRGREIVAANPGVKWGPGVEIELPKD